MQSELKKSLREIAKYHGLYEVLRDEKFVGTSQKSSGKSRPEAGRDDGKGDWDGTESSGENTYSTKKKMLRIPQQLRTVLLPLFR